MLRVTIEYIPSGDEKRKRTIRTMTISNASNLADVSDYLVKVTGENSAHTSSGVVRGHERKRLGVWALLSRAIRSLDLDLEG
jgi:hypothetical protein